MRSRRKILFATVGALATVVAFAGCSATPTTAATNGKVSITVAGLIPGSTKEAVAAFNARVTAFERANPNITLKSEEYQWTGPTFATQLAGGTLPDVFNVPFTDSKALIQKGQLADITSLVKALPYANKFNQNVLSEAENAGKIYGLPYGPYAMGLSYNRALFTKAGLDPNKPPTTWAEVEQDAKIISTKLPGVAGYMQMTSGNTGGWELAATTYARGGRLESVNSSGKTVVKTDNTQTKAALQFLHDLRWTDNAAGSNFLLDWSGINQAFGSGQIAMYVSGSDVLTSLVETDGVNPTDYGLAPLPLTGKNSGVLSGGSVIAVSPKATAAQKAAAVKWMDFYYIQPLVNKTQTVDAAKVLAASNQPVGVPTLPVFNQATYNQQQQWIKPEVNIPLSNVAPFTSKIFTEPIVPEPNKDTQQLYGALDSVVQAVLTNKNANVDTLLKGVDSQIQALVDSGQ